MKQLLIDRLKAHRKYLYSRVLNVEKGEAFDRCLERMINILNSDNYCNIHELENHVDFVSIRNYFYSQKNIKYHEGVYFCVDIYKEICDNDIKRFVDGYSRDYCIEKL